MSTGMFFMGERTLKCGCVKCLDDGWLPNRFPNLEYVQPSRRRMVVCSICGNKRCPHATDHDLACTGTNEPGQKGSQYE
jgi:hypothetical protein